MPAVKRKQTDAMEQSPPKRVTRARTARTTTTTKITPGSVKAVAAAKAAPKPARTAASRIINEVVEEESADELERIEVAPPVKRGRGRPKKDAPQTSAGSTSKVATAKPAIKSTRTRVTAPKGEPEEEKMTRTTAAARAARGAARGTGKKVMFDEQGTHNKENLPLETAPKSTSAKPTSVKSTSTRKTTTTNAATKATTTKPPVPRGARGRKPATKAADVDETPPLSPKKVTQVAKNSISSEDELCEKPSVPGLDASPKKAPASVRSVIKVTTASKLVRPPTPASPTKAPEQSVIQSPAKRPPPSPFKDAIKASPKKFVLPPSPTKSNAVLSQPSFQHSLKASPKKINLAISSISTSGSPWRSPFKDSLKSPAKRPASPEKMGIFPAAGQSPSKTLANADDSTFKLPTITPRRLFVSPQREKKATSSAKSPSPIRQSPAKVAFVQYNTNPLDAYKHELAQQGRPTVSETPRYRPAPEDSDSEEDHPTSPSKGFAGGTPTFIFKTPNGKTHRRETMGITPLALKMSTWCAATPEDGHAPSSPEGNVSAPATPHEDNESSVVRTTPRTPGNANFFEMEMRIREDEPIYGMLVEPVTDLHIAEPEMPPLEKLGSSLEVAEDLHQVSDSNDSFIAADEDEGSDDSMPSNESDAPGTDMLEELRYGSPAKDVAYLQTFDAQESQESENYGDENAIPIDPRILAGSFEEVATEEEVVVEPATPVVPTYRRPREIHTISKVPLRKEGPEESPIKVTRKRSKSTSAPLSELPDLVRDGSVLSQALRIIEESNETSTRKVSYETSIINALMTPKKGTRSGSSSPTKSVRAAKEAAEILRGAVVFVDVHTSEGADASSIFVELLTQMGARCVKQWTWNPQQSDARGAKDGQESTSSGKVGITHVVFKDGGKRTLQKVRDAKGLVLAVGVSWVLDCERENKWLDEANYAVDTSTIPRGGHNRRKSMEPKMVSNQGGTLVPTTTPTKSSYEVASPTNEFRSFSAASRRSSIRLSPIDASEPQPLPPATPTPYVPGDGDETCDLTMCGSPTTPYYLSKGAQLVQQTCPPKQTGQPLFPVTGRIEDQPNESVRQRLLLARRKSLQWAPKIGSPLGRTVSYDRY